MLFRVEIFSLSLASLESKLEIMEDRAPVEIETEITPMIINRIHKSFSCKLTALMSP
jgi:hypothetical protein